MTPQELKYSIIFLALQGKLVGQNKDDSPVDLSGIKSKNTEECEFDIPDSWGLAHLETVTNGIPSKQYQILESEVQQTGRYPVISQSKAYSIGFSDDSDKVYHHTKPVIVFGDHTTEVKYVEFDFVVGADGVKIFEPIDGIVTADFLFYVFLFYSKDLSKVGGYSRHYKFIKNKPVPLPPLAEQKRIVAKIEELLPLIDRYEQAWSALEAFNARFPVDMQKSILQMAIQGKLVPQLPEEGTGEELLKILHAEKDKIVKSGVLKGRKTKPLQKVSADDIPFEIPDTWCWIRLGNVAEIFGRIGFRGYTKNDIVPAGEGAITISPSNIRPNGKTDFSDCTYLSWEKYEESPEIKVFEGDILLVKTGSSYGKCGIVCDLPKKATINPQLAILKYVTCDVTYLDYALKSPMARSQFESFVIGTSIPTFSQEKLANLLLPLPPLAEQKRIVAKLEEILPLCEHLK